MSKSVAGKNNDKKMERIIAVMNVVYNIIITNQILVDFRSLTYFLKKVPASTLINETKKKIIRLSGK